MGPKKLYVAVMSFLPRFHGPLEVIDGKVDRVTANHSLSSTASQGTSKRLLAATHGNLLTLTYSPWTISWVQP